MLQLHLSLNEEVLPAVSQLLQVRAGRLCAVRLQPVVLGSLTQEQWRGSGYQQHGQGPGPGPGSEVALDLEAIAAVPNVEEDKMKQHPSLPGLEVGEEGNKEQTCGWGGRKEEAEVGKSRGEEQVPTGVSVAQFRNSTYLVASSTKHPFP